MPAKPILCPSSECKEGAILLGIVQPEGRIGFFSDKIPINNEFVKIASEGRTPEKRFRFSSPCLMSGCKQWTGSRCGVIDTATARLPENDVEELPNCSIRPQCRWYLQMGSHACKVCPLIITNIEERKESLSSPQKAGKIATEAGLFSTMSHSGGSTPASQNS